MVPKAYPFPMLESAQILEYMENLCIPITKADLLKPSSAQMIRVFEILLEFICGIPREQLTNALASFVKQNGNVTEFPELYSDSMSIVAYYYLL